MKIWFLNYLKVENKEAVTKSKICKAWEKSHSIYDNTKNDHIYTADFISIIIQKTDRVRWRVKDTGSLLHTKLDNSISTETKCQIVIERINA